jgi:hypothetical protein
MSFVVLAGAALADAEYFAVSGHLGHVSETAATQRALRELPGALDAVVSLGGESFLVYILTGDRITNVLPHNKCAAGSGEFFVQQIGRMGLDMEEARRPSDSRSRARSSRWPRAARSTASRTSPTSSTGMRPRRRHPRPCTSGRPVRRSSIPTFAWPCSRGIPATTSRPDSSMRSPPTWKLPVMGPLGPTVRSLALRAAGASAVRPFTPCRLAGGGRVVRSNGEQVPLDDPRVKSYFPNFSPYHARALGMAVRWLGLHAGDVAPLDRDQVERGLQHASGRECLPLPITPETY